MSRLREIGDNPVPDSEIKTDIRDNSHSYMFTIPLTNKKDQDSLNSDVIGTRVDLIIREEGSFADLLWFISNEQRGIKGDSDLIGILKKIVDRIKEEEPPDQSRRRLFKNPFEKFKKFKMRTLSIFFENVNRKSLEKWHQVNLEDVSVSNKITATILKLVIRFISQFNTDVDMITFEANSSERGKVRAYRAFTYYIAQHWDFEPLIFDNSTMCTFMLVKLSALQNIINNLP